jgi:hypothetical protein
MDQTPTLQFSWNTMWDFLTEFTGSTGLNSTDLAFARGILLPANRVNPVSSCVVLVVPSWFIVTGDAREASAICA